MTTLSQILVIVGLFLEFFSVTITIRKAFWGYYRRLDERGKTDRQKERSDKIDGIIIVILLGAGMILQGVATFVSP